MDLIFSCLLVKLVAFQTSRDLHEVEQCSHHRCSREVFWAGASPPLSSKLLLSPELLQDTKNHRMV